MPMLEGNAMVAGCVPGHDPSGRGSDEQHLLIFFAQPDGVSLTRHPAWTFIGELNFWTRFVGIWWIGTAL
jgi:hypothetical protein